MEFPNLGIACAFTTCKQLDFLPFICSHCHLVFCKDHFEPTHHTCTKFSVTKEEEKNEVGLHTFYCEMDSCKVGTPVRMICENCEKHYCLAHRHHGCFEKSEEEIKKGKEFINEVKSQFEKSRSEAQTMVSQNIEKAKINPKKAATALKVQLMRLKGKAVGDKSIMTSERVYFLAILPLTSTTARSKAVYVSKQWTYGRVIDAIANLCNVINRNNESNADKLRLFKKSDGHQLTTKLDTKLSDLILENTISDGESLILEYVKSSENLNEFVLMNASSYTE